MYVRQVTMTNDAGLWIVHLQGAQQVQQGILLQGGTGVGGFPVFVQAALIADAYRVGIITFGMGPGHLFRSSEVQLTVAGDVEVVATAVAEASCPVVSVQLFEGVALVTTCSRTMNDYQLYLSHIRQ